MLIDQGSITAIIDWDGCRAGDRLFDLVTLALGMGDAQAEERAEKRVWNSSKRNWTAGSHGLSGAHVTSSGGLVHPSSLRARCAEMAIALHLPSRSIPG
ncbi:MAG: phosphotransferase [Actinobacteria bacterium]|nr:phosphotransferase [Actinomycetota bacterium]